MEKQIRVECPENEELAAYLWTKWREMAQTPKGVSENIDITLSKAYSNLCSSKMPIRSLRDFAQIKGVGKWILRLVQGFFEVDSVASENEELTKKGKKTKETKRYMPQKNSVAYALLITLYRGTSNGDEFMLKQELIDSAEASGLSRTPVVPEKGKAKPGQFGSSPRDWYSGWSCMKTLISKGLVVKSSCPAKYMLTEEGKEAARQCLFRSGLVDSTEKLAMAEELSNLDQSNKSGLEFSNADPLKELKLPSAGSSSRKKSIDIPPESFDRFISMGYSKGKIVRAFTEVLETSQNKEISSLWPAVLCRLREDQVYGLPLMSLNTQRDCLPSASYKSTDGEGDDLVSKKRSMDSACTGALPEPSLFVNSTWRSSNLRACSSIDYPLHKGDTDGLEAKTNVLAMPPLMFGERFEDVYGVILILDDREQFATRGSRSRKIIENTCSQFKIQIEVRRLPVGDGIWIARHKYLGSEYVLDFIVERKKVDDLRCSIRDNRYRDQKLRLLRCGLKKMIYLVEGDPNSSEAAESIKTA
ncbi:unnamed protein product [Ilex paraguariensis]|uniref:Crossover junction endonuclease MUS81 n=1 Tax=Ilex paraguariensis TaxID=185542 RepID=A0ABC8RWY4_9AQUA